MRSKRLLVMCVVIGMGTAAAHANYINIHADGTTLTITDRTDPTHVLAGISAGTGGGALTAEIRDDATVPIYDGVEIDGYKLDMALTFTGANNMYSATGTLNIWDTGASPKLVASFVSDSVDYSTYALPFGLSFSVLSVGGSVSAVAGNSSLLLPGSDPWVFTGNGPSPGAGDSDGVPTTITVASELTNYRYGALVSFNFPDTYPDLQSLFAGLDPTVGINGSVDVVIPSVPAPGALLLGVLGAAGVAGLRRRRSL